MMTNATDEIADLLSRQVLARALACALADPRSPLARPCSSEDVTLLRTGWDVMASTYTPTNPSQLGLGERLPQRVSIRPLEQWLSLDTRRRERAYQAVFGLTMSKICPPYETEYCEWKDPTHRAQHLADVSGFYCAFGLEPSRSVPERADNIALEIEFVAFLIEKLLSLRRTADRGSAEHEAVCRDALSAFVADHVVWWMPTFGRCLERRIDQSRTEESCGRPQHDIDLLAGVGRWLCGWVAAERAATGVKPHRRIVGPQVAAQERSDLSCATCAACGDDSA